VIKKKEGSEKYYFIALFLNIIEVIALQSSQF